MVRGRAVRHCASGTKMGTRRDKEVQKGTRRGKKRKEGARKDKNGVRAGARVTFYCN